MSAVLELDVGNTRVKWRIVDVHGNALQSGHWAHGGGALPEDAQLDRLLEDNHCRSARVGSVAAEAVNDRLRKWATTRRLGMRFAHSSAESAGVSNSYRQPGLMGVDRWLAMLAAFNQYPGNICVIDCGTALTIDVVNAAGQHLGGLIMPGIRLQQNALREYTDKVIFNERPRTAELQLGNDTAGCVHNGSKFMLVGAIHEVLSHSKRLLGGEMACIMTGGDADLLAPLLQAPLQDAVIVAPDIVLDGLKYALP